MLVLFRGSLPRQREISIELPIVYVTNHRVSLTKIPVRAIDTRAITVIWEFRQPCPLGELSSCTGSSDQLLPLFSSWIPRAQTVHNNMIPSAAQITGVYEIKMMWYVKILWKMKHFYKCKGPCIVIILLIIKLSFNSSVSSPLKFPHWFV